MNISTSEQYESVCGLLKTLQKLNVTSAKEMLNDFVEYEGQEWTPCYDCDEPAAYCSCDKGGTRYGKEYDDEASFE